MWDFGGVRKGKISSRDLARDMGLGLHEPQKPIDEGVNLFAAKASGVFWGIELGISARVLSVWKLDAECHEASRYFFIFSLPQNFILRMEDTAQQVDDLIANSNHISKWVEEQPSESQARCAILPEMTSFFFMYVF